MADIARDAGLTGNEGALEGASRLFLHLWNGSWAQAPGTRAGDSEALHDMRVELRRLRTLMGNFEGERRAPLLSKRIRRELRGWKSELGALGDALGATRDFDVLGDYLIRYSGTEGADESGEGLIEFAHFLETRRARAFKAMDAAIAAAQPSIKNARLGEKFTRWCLGLPGASAPALSLRAVAHSTLRQRLAHTRSLAPALEAQGQNPSLDEARHELRRSLRRVRYTLESFSVCFDFNVKPVVKKLVAVQDLLGEMQDRAVLEAATLKCFGSNVLPDDVRIFNEHGDTRQAQLLEEARAAWRKTSAALDLRLDPDAEAEAASTGRE